MHRLCIIGLGNPGLKYDHTRHNIGKDWLIDLSSKFFKEFKTKSKYEADIGESHNGEVLWVIPSNYVNNSGSTVKKILKSSSLSISDILIIHDDLDLNPGDLRLKESGGHGGHNGLRDIIEKIGEKNFKRLRVGIGHPGEKSEVTNWVLRKFSPNEKKLMNSSYEKFKKVFEMICSEQFEAVQKIHHTK